MHKSSALRRLQKFLQAGAVEKVTGGKRGRTGGLARYRFVGEGGRMTPEEIRKVVVRKIEVEKLPDGQLLIKMITPAGIVAALEINETEAWHLADLLFAVSKGARTSTFSFTFRNVRITLEPIGED